MKLIVIDSNGNLGAHIYKHSNFQIPLLIEEIGKTSTKYLYSIWIHAKFVISIYSIKSFITYRNIIAMLF